MEQHEIRIWEKVQVWEDRLYTFKKDISSKTDEEIVEMIKGGEWEDTDIREEVDYETLDFELPLRRYNKNGMVIPYKGEVSE